MVAVLDQVDAAVEDVDAVVAVFRSSGQDEAVAVGGAGQDTRAGRGDLEQAAVHFFG